MPRVEPGGIVRFAGGFCLENATPDPMIVESDPYTMTIRVSRAPEVNAAIDELERTLRGEPLSPNRPLNASETRELMDRIEMMQRQAEEHRQRERQRRAQTGMSEGGLIADALQMYRNVGAQAPDPVQEAPQVFPVSPDMLERLRAVIAGAGAGPVDPVRLSAGAHRRARILLLRHLNLKQRRSFKEHGSFTVRGNRTGARYIIKQTGRVVRSDDNHEFCLQVVGEAVPDEDAILARKILIESDEQLFLGTANDLTDPRQSPPATWREATELQRACYNAARERRQAELNALSAQYDLRPPLEAPNSTWREWLRRANILRASRDFYR